MFSKVLKFFNENHWYLIAISFIVALALWSYGCVSTTQSLIDNSKLITRSELMAELNYLVDLAESRVADLDRQDSAKQALLDAAQVIGQSGTVNPAGFLNLAATIGAIAFGLNRNQKYKTALKIIEEKEGT